jgi:hypothetical protein
MLWCVRSATTADRSSRRRRAWYAAYRATRVLWHALVREKAAWHIAIITAVLSAAAIALVRLTAEVPDGPDSVVYGALCVRRRMRDRDPRASLPARVADVSG